MSSRKKLWIVVGSLALLSACRTESTAPLMARPTAISEAKHVSISTVPLVVTIANYDALGAPYNIQGDGGGAYTDGVQDVEAVLDNNGTFAFNTETNIHRSATRWVTYNFNSPVDPSNSYRPNPTNLENYHFSTGASKFSPNIPVQNLGVNGNPVSECIYMGNSIANSTTQWRVSFHKGLEDVADSPTAYAVVTRTSVTPAVWTIASSGACSPNSDVAALRSGDSSVLYGYYKIPFLFTLKAK